MHTDRWLDVFFGKGDDDFPFWLMTVRADILIFLLCGGVVLAWKLRPAVLRRAAAQRADIGVALALTALAAALRFVVASPNLMDYGGIPYSRLLLGYKGHFATAQFYSLFYQLTARDIEHAILLDRIAGTLTVPLVYLLCRQLQPANRFFAPVAALLFAVSPLHILFSASDALPVFSMFLAAASYVLLAADAGTDDPLNMRRVRYLGGLAGLALLTQVRYENALFFVPVVLFALARRRSVQLRELWPGVLVTAAFLAIYAFSALTAGLSFQNPVVISSGVPLLIHHLFLNPFFAIPTLLVGTLAVPFFGSFALGLLCLLPLPMAFALSLLADSGHGQARVFCGWLILILPVAAYGFSLLLSSRWRAAKLVAAIALVHLAVQPLLWHDRLGARHLEMRENDFFRRVLSELPPGVKRIVVPDDELLRRETHSTNEVFSKYAMILTEQDLAQRPEVVGLTAFLEQPSKGSCTGDACVFFFGLPCLEQRVYPYAREQCRQVLETFKSSMLDETEMVAAPFLDCSIYTGALYERLCAPQMTRQRFAAYRIEG